MADQNDNGRLTTLSFKKSTSGLSDDEQSEYENLQRKNKMTNDVINGKTYSTPIPHGD